MKSASREVLLTVKQAAERLGVAPNTVRAWGGSGKLPEYRHPMNNYRLYKPADIEAVLAEITRIRPPAGHSAAPAAAPVRGGATRRGTGLAGRAG